MQFIKDFIYCTVAPQKMVMVVVNKQYIDVYIFWAGHATNIAATTWPCFQSKTCWLPIALCQYWSWLRQFDTEALIFFVFFLSLKLHYVVAKLSKLSGAHCPDLCIWTGAGEAVAETAGWLQPLLGEDGPGRGADSTQYIAGQEEPGHSPLS